MFNRSRPELPDSGDALFMEVVIAATAECLVIGNDKHFSVGRLPGASVLTPRAFLDKFLEQRLLLPDLVGR